MEKALGIVNFAANNIWVDGLSDYRPIGAFSFLGRYRVIDFALSNLSNSGIDQIQVYVRRKPRSLVEHIGTGRHYNINSKRGKVHLLFPESELLDDMYNTDISAFLDNLEIIERNPCPYIVIAPSYMIYAMNFDSLLETHIESGADITLLYHAVDNAKEQFLFCDTLDLNRQKGVLSIEPNRGNAKNRNIFMDTYVLKKDLFIDLVKKAKKTSSVFTFANIVDAECNELDIRGVSHRGYFTAITDFKSYYNANLALIDYKSASNLFDEKWPIYTRTNDSCPTQYFDGADVKSSVVSNGCLIEGSIENSVIGRGCTIKKGAVIKNSILLPGVMVSENAHIENMVLDKRAKIVHVKDIVATPEKPGYVKRSDTL